MRGKDKVDVMILFNFKLILDLGQRVQTFSYDSVLEI